MTNPRLVVGMMAFAIIPTLLSAGEPPIPLDELFGIFDTPFFVMNQEGECTSSADLALATPTVETGTRLFSGAGFSATDRWSITLSEEGAYQIHYDGNLVFSCRPGELSTPLFTTDSPSFLYMLSNAFGQDSMLARIGSNGEVQIIYSNPCYGIDGVVGAGVGGVELAAAYHFGNRIRYHFFSPALEEVHKIATAKFPDADILWINGDGNKSQWLCKMFYRDRPECWYLFIAGQPEPVALHVSRPVADVIEPVPFSYPTRDGLEAPGYLTLPTRGKTPYPLVVFVHGGPADRAYPYFDPRVQALVREGYAVFQPNYRGSRGFGKAWLEAGWCEWGTGVAQHDITDGVFHLIGTGTADPRRIAVFGGSFGGYAALAGLAFTPELYACGIAFFGPSDLLDFVREDKGLYAAMNRPMYGNVENREDMERLISQSPLHACEKIQAPLFLYHGAADPLVPVSHSDAVAAELTKRGNVIEYHRHPTAGHGFLDANHEADIFSELLHFLGKHLRNE